MIVVKINEVPTSQEKLRERASRPWRININRLYGEKELIVTYKGKILEVYDVLSYGRDIVEANKITFALVEKDSDLRGKQISYKTSNPCTIVEELQFAE